MEPVAPAMGGGWVGALWGGGGSVPWVTPQPAASSRQDVSSASARAVPRSFFTESTPRARRVRKGLGVRAGPFVRWEPSVSADGGTRQPRANQAADAGAGLQKRMPKVAGMIPSVPSPLVVLVAAGESTKTYRASAKSFARLSWPKAFQ